MMSFAKHVLISMSAPKPQGPFKERGFLRGLTAVAKKSLFVKKCCKSAKAELIFLLDSEKR